MAALLDELAGVYQRARELAVRIYDQLGIGGLDGSREGAWT